MPEVAIGAKSIGVQHSMGVSVRVEFPSWVELALETAGEIAILVVALPAVRFEESTKKTGIAVNNNNNNNSLVIMTISDPLLSS